MKAAELREKAKLWLRAKYPDALILHELSLAEYGGALVDVAAITPDRIVGVEIKGEGDGPTRLMRQGYLYSRICRSMFILCDQGVWSKCAKHVPDGWGVLELSPPEDKFNNYKICEASGLATYKYRTPDETGYGLASAALAAMPWTKEYRQFELLVKANLPETKAKFIGAVAEKYPVRTIERAVCGVLRQRNWEGKPVDRPASLVEEITAKKQGKLL